MSFSRNIRTWCGLGWRRRWILLEAVVTLPIAWLLLRLVPFKRIAAWLGTAGRETDSVLPSGSRELGGEIGWAVRAAAVRFPGDATCLVQGLTAAAMTRRRQVPSTLYLGVARGQGEAVDAHAWVRCGDLIVTGREGHQRFQVLERFGRG